MSRNLIIFGTGAMGRLLASFIGLPNIRAFAADDKYIDAPPEQVLGLGRPVVRYSRLQELCPPSEFNIAMGIGYYEMNDVRLQRYGALRLMGYEIRGYDHGGHRSPGRVGVSPSAVLYENVVLHHNARVCDNAFLASNISVGHDCVIGHSAWLNSGVSLGGGVQVGAGCVLGMNSCVAEGVTLGARTFVGANTLVTDDTPAESVVVSPSGEHVAVTSKRFLQLIK